MRQKSFTLLAFAIIVLLAFLKLGQHPVSPWDEARNGINAIEMLRNGDWLNLYFSGQPDTWNTKPPLFIWCVAISFKLLGFNELALRLPSALAIVASFFLVFKIITLYRSATFATCTCLLLASVKGLIGWHVGRTGDFDAMLVFFLLASVYGFLLQVDFGKKKAVLATGLCLGMAFLVKGPAAGVLLPGMVFYVVLTKKSRLPLRSKTAWAGAALALAFPVGWFVAQYFFGQRFLAGEVSDNAFRRLFSVDLWKRFSQSGEGWKEPFDLSFLFYSLDKSFNLWHFVFFGLLGFGLFHLLKNKARALDFLLENEKNKLLLLSICLYLPLAVFLAIAAKSNRWYLAPALPFVGIATFWGIRCFWWKHGWVKFAFFGLLAFTLGRRFHDIWRVPPKPAIITAHAADFAQASAIIQSGRVEQDVLCYLYFANSNLRFSAAPDSLRAGELLFLRKENGASSTPPGLKIIGEDERYLILQTMEDWRTDETDITD